MHLRGARRAPPARQRLHDYEIDVGYSVPASWDTRSETAIKVQLRREDADRKDPHHCSASALAQLFGVDPKRVTGWILRGLLKAERRGTDRVATQRGDSWWIHRRAVRRFIIDNASAFDIRKVDKFWFVDLLANEGGGE